MFDFKGEDMFRAEIKRMKLEERDRLAAEQKLAIDYLNNRQVNDIEQQLLERFPSSQYGNTGQEIYPITIPLTERFIAEAANAYNRGVSRKFVELDGSESDESKNQTLELNRYLDEIHYDEIMHANERYTILLKTSCVWFQEDEEGIKPTVVFPYLVYPILPDNQYSFDVSNPNKYSGFVIESDYAKEDISKITGNSYIYLNKEKTVFFSGYGPDKADEVLGEMPNFYNQAMISFWHTSLPCNELIIHSDAEIARMNRELNLLWSVIFDTLRFQSYSTPVKKLNNPGDPKAKQKHGSRFPVILDINEDFGYASASAPYTETVSILDQAAKTLAVAKRLSPNDFSITGSTALSGFAKLVDSLPKIEQRQERIKRLKYMEEKQAGPMLVKILTRNRILDESAKRMRLQVQFADVEFPKAPSEIAQEWDLLIKYNLTTPAKLLAEKKHISIEEAEAEIEENKAKNSGQMQAPATTTSPTTALYEQLINKKKNKEKEKADVDNKQTMQ